MTQSQTIQFSKFQVYLKVLAVLILGLMGLGAGVRAMNAGLSCPDWPLCFGQVIPDFHVGVWFEFVHRAYAGLVAILFAGGLGYVFRRRSEMPVGVRRAAVFGAVVLFFQIVMGGLTVLLLVKAVIVTGHLLLATLFLSSVLWMIFELAQSEKVAKPLKASTWILLAASILPVLVFMQIAIGGLVASTYSGSVCVDWPLCNGQWVPTWKGAIGLQVIHRFYAYGLVVVVGAIASLAILKRCQIDTQLGNRLAWCGAFVIAQTIVGILNLIWFIPAWLTVFHQTMALLLLGFALAAAHRAKQIRLASQAAA